MNPALDLGVHALRDAYRAGTLTVRQVIDEVLVCIGRAGDDKVWISRFSDLSLQQTAEALDAQRAEIEALPLYGIPFAVKDNIDVEGLATTAACPGFAYQPTKSADVVELLVDAGAIVIGKTNLDQFTIGLAGVNSPYGVPRNPFDASYIPGSGSAVAVSSGLVSFSLGTDTAGSGRVPAALNNIVGFKPTPTLLSNEGTVPVCRSLDCVSLFTLSCSDAAAIWDVIYAPSSLSRAKDKFQFGVPDRLEFFGDRDYAHLYARSIKKLEEIGGTPVEFDYGPFLETAQLLHRGPFLAEHTAVIGDFIEKAATSAGVLPPTREVILSGLRYRAVDAFQCLHRLAELQYQLRETLHELEFLSLPTTGTTYTLKDLKREPVRCNSNLGYYTNFVNLLSLSALALPAGFRSDGQPFGITLAGQAIRDVALLEYGMRWQRAMPLPLGRTASALPPPRMKPEIEPRRILVAVVGAHMSDFPLNEQLVELGGRFERSGKTAPLYRLFALPGGPPRRPGMVRVAEDGAAIELEVWSLPAWGFGDFVAKISSPLSIGTVLLDGGSSVPGFLCEAYATYGARDITEFGGWRSYAKTVD